MIGPVAFTLAWVVASLRQPGLSFTQAQLSGLAAENARNPWIMICGFLVLGGCSLPFAWALRASLRSWARGGQAGGAPGLIAAAGLLTIAAGLLRRDHVLLTAGPQSWHNEAHNVVSAVDYVLLIAVPLLLARRLRHRAVAWRAGLASVLLTAAAVSAALLVVFYATPHQPWDGLLQRIAVTLPLAAIAAVALRVMVAAWPGVRRSSRSRAVR